MKPNALRVVSKSEHPKQEKIKNISELSVLVKGIQACGKTVVHCHGVFDLLHIGHIRHFEQASQMGDVLIVTITPDHYVDKGPYRPAFTEFLRAEAIASLNCVDYVAINEWPTAVETLKCIRPDIYVKGAEFKNTDDDFTGKIAEESAVVTEIGARIAFTEDLVFSSSNLINRYLTNMPREIDQYLELFRKRYGLQDVLTIIDNMVNKKVLVIGDTIIDDYQYCHAIGKSSKDPTLVLKYTSNDYFVGGVLAVANHIAGYAGHVDLLTVIGEKESHEAFIRSQLNPLVKNHFYIQPDAPTIIKRRFIDAYSFNKLFEVYIWDDTGLPPAVNMAACTWLKKFIENYDLVVAADFGHGAISEEMVDIMTERSPFLAVNTQANAGNRGFHTISRYRKADFACIAEHEMRLETRMRNGNLRPKMHETAKKLGCENFIVTRGRSGCAVCDSNDGFVQIPSFARHVVDRVGAGDAFLALTSLAAVQRVPYEILGFLGNVTGALAVETIGNKKAIDQLSIRKFITSLLK